MSTESITLEEPNGDCWVCVCTNTPDGSGFYPVGPDGRWVEPTIGSAWDGVSYGCGACGRIVHQFSLLVTGTMSEAARSEEQPG
jgi:hypothetical protein